MRTIIDNLKEMSGQIRNLFRSLLLGYSSIYLWNVEGGPFVVISPSGDYAYRELGQEGRRVQARLLDDYRRFHALLTVLLSGQPQDTLDSLSEAHTILLHTIEQDHTWCKNTQEALDRAVEALEAELHLLDRLYDCSGGESTYVPDTNALLSNPDLESWSLPEADTFTMILLPTVLSELDSLKVNHRNEDVRKKAEGLIRRIKEYRRRGNLTTGIPLARDEITLQAVAVEPNMQKSLPWLDSANRDDRILAGVIEILRSRPRSPVIAVSADINFQNKAQFAGVPVEEPPTL